MATTASERLPIAELLPDSATVDDGELAVAGVPASKLADEFGTPLVVYCRDTLAARARAYRTAGPDLLVVYGAKAFLNVAVIRLFGAEGLGVDAWGMGELSFALRGEIPAER